MTITTYNLNTFKLFSDSFAVSYIAIGEFVLYTDSHPPRWCCYGIILAIYDNSITVLWVDS